MALIAIAVIAIFGIQGMSFAFEDSGRDVDISGESWSPDAGNVTILDKSEISDAYYDENVTVKDDGGKTMDYGSDYIWHQNNGTVFTVSGGELDGSPSATIDYGYDRVNEQQKSLASLSGGVLQVLPPMLFIGLLALFVAFIRGAA